MSRHGTPIVQGFYILHEGLIGTVGDEVYSIDYDDLQDEGERLQTFEGTAHWLGYTDKYWAVTVIPDPKTPSRARFADNPRNGRDVYQTDFLSNTGISIAAGGRTEVTNRLFAGAKVVSTIDTYQEQYDISKFRLLIDWGWFYFITQPLVLCDRLLIQAGRQFRRRHPAGHGDDQADLPAACQQVLRLDEQDEEAAAGVVKLRERYKDDRMKQQQEMMELYKKEKVSPMSGCWPIIIQIPVFFALYKVLFGTIEMRHAAVLRLDPGPVGARPDIAVQPVRPDPVGPAELPDDRRLADPDGHHHVHPDAPQPAAAGPDPGDDLQLDAAVFHLPAGHLPGRPDHLLGLEQPVSVTQQYYIMRRQGVKVELWDNLKSTFSFVSKFLSKFLNKKTSGT